MATRSAVALMTRPIRLLPWLALLLVAASAAEPPESPAPAQSAHTPAESDEAPAEHAETLALTPSQQQAVGLRIEHPLPIAGRPQIEALGLVLDPVALVSDLGRMDSTRAAAAAATAEAARQEKLYRDDTQASLKAMQASQALAVEAVAQAQAAAASFELQWGPLASWSAERRRSLTDALSTGRKLLLRADVPGRHAGSLIAHGALLQVDGVNVAARVLGALPRTDPRSQSAGWLLEVERRPDGVGPGARIPVRLQTAPVAGLLVSAAALVYDDRGAYVYRRVGAGEAGASRFAAVMVKPLARLGEGWLVDGLERTDDIVVQGAGVLWSLQGISSFSAAEEEHD